MKNKKRVEKSKEAGKISEVIWSVFLWLWLSIGILILFWTLYWYIQMIAFQGLGVIAIAVIFASGVYMLAIYNVRLKFLTNLFKSSEYSKRQIGILLLSFAISWNYDFNVFRVAGGEGS